jgi:hypothetical protein
MDPNETLRQLRKAFADMDNATDRDDFEIATREAQDLFEALDNWLTRGGFVPRDWASKTLEAPR